MTMTRNLQKGRMFFTSELMCVPLQAKAENPETTTSSPAEKPNHTSTTTSGRLRVSNKHCASSKLKTCVQLTSSTRLTDVLLDLLNASRVLVQPLLFPGGACRRPITTSGSIRTIMTDRPGVQHAANTSDQRIPYARLC